MLSSHPRAYKIVQLHQSTEMNTIYTKTLPCIPSEKKEKKMVLKYIGKYIEFFII